MSSDTRRRSATATSANGTKLVDRAKADIFHAFDGLVIVQDHHILTLLFVHIREKSRRCLLGLA
jgi:hypothetical protein